MCRRIVTCATLAISYQHSSIDVITTEEEYDDECIELSRSDYDNNVDRVQNSGVEVIYKGRVERSRSMSTCAIKSKWTRSRSRFRNAERPTDLRKRNDSVSESAIDYQRITIDFAEGAQEYLGTSEGDYDDICLDNDPRMVIDRRDMEMKKEYDVDGDRIPFCWPPFRVGMPKLFAPVTPFSSALKVAQKLNDDDDDYVNRVQDSDVGATKSKCFYEFLEKRRSREQVIDCPPDLGTYIDGMMGSIDYDYQFEHGTSNIDECLPCEEQTGIEVETIEIDRVIIEWCCGYNRLGQPSKHSPGCRVVRLTIDDDLRTLDGFHEALNIARHCPPN
jgi:hypothetical protein